jgi:hypothetical protein
MRVHAGELQTLDGVVVCQMRQTPIALFIACLLSPSICRASPMDIYTIMMRSTFSRSMNSFPELLFALLLGGLVLGQLITGKALDRRWRPTITREDDPGWYWFMLLVQSAILIAVVVTGKTLWR